MNNENKDFFNNDVEANVSEDEIVLAPPTELIEEAKEIAQNTKANEKFHFMLQYDANQKDHLQSMLQMVGAVVEDDDEEGHKLSTRMNMTQLAFIKRLECVERVRTNRVHNPFLMEQAEQPATVAETPATTAEPQTAEAMHLAAMMQIVEKTQPPRVMTLTADETAEVVADPITPNADDGIAVACVGGSSSACSCPTNISMESAQEIQVERSVSGRICCPGAEQWFKFTVPQTKQYTIYTDSSLDMVGVLYDCCGNYITKVDDVAGMTDFRIVRTLTVGTIYYVRVYLADDDTGNYTLKITEKPLAESVLIHPNRSDGVIVLEQGKTYELPRGEGYGFLNVANTENAPLSVEINPYATTEKRVTWSESSIPSDPVDTNFAWYDNTTKYQTITAKSCGGTKLYAYDWNEYGKRGEAYVAVIPRGGSLEKATGISLDYTFLTLDIGDYQKIAATVSPSTATVTDVDWKSDNPSVATVTPYGRVKGVSSGTANIYAIAMDGSGKAACCTVHVCHIPVTGVKLDRSRKIISLNDTEQLIATIYPSNAKNKNVFWNSSNWGVVDVDNNGVITGLKEGTATISATTNEGGYISTCIVTVDKRPKVMVERDEEYSFGDEDYFNITFSNGKVWRSIGCDLALDENRSGLPLWNKVDCYDSFTNPEQRYVDNIEQTFSAKELALIYRLDPLGIEYYMKTNACDDMTLAEGLFFKDDVYKAIFGEPPSNRFYFTINDSGQVHYGTYAGWNRTDVYSNAETLFGSHVIFDWSNFWQSILTTLFEAIPGVSHIQTGVEIYQALFHAGSFWGLYSSCAKSKVEEYVNEPLDNYVKEKLGEKAHKCIGWANNLISMLKDATISAFVIPNLNDITIYDTIEEQDDYRVVFENYDGNLSLQEIIDLCGS